MIYRVPSEFYQRLHHVRPRFKNNIEEVLFFICNEISSLGILKNDEFKINLFQAIKRFPENINKTDKTIHNWRTEISALFALIQAEGDNCSKPSAMAIKLALENDLVQFFKYFMYYFQYPGGFLKENEVVAFIKVGIKFKPAKYILKVLIEGEKLTGKRFPLNKAEVTHLIFNDLRVTSGIIDELQKTKEIIEHRKKGTEYDWDGDSIRYAGDVLDYMLIANLLKLRGDNFYINRAESSSISLFINNNTWFSGYDDLYEMKAITTEMIDNKAWFDFVNQDIGKNIFRTNLGVYLLAEEDSAIQEYPIKDTFDFKNTKEIGDFGEALVFEHELAKIKQADREDLSHLIKRIPTHLAVGYDIQSVEPNATKRYIEVKTTVSSKPLTFFRFHLTPNEWNAAETLKDKYYIYRVSVSKEGSKLIVINNPVGMYKNEKASMSPVGGADMFFSSDSGKQEEVLTWKN